MSENVERLTRALWDLQQATRELEARVEALETATATALSDARDRLAALECWVKGRDAMFGGAE